MNNDFSKYIQAQAAFSKNSCRKQKPPVLKNHLETQLLQKITHPNCNSGIPVRNQELSLCSNDSQLPSQRRLKPALFLDRDGTLIREVDHCHRAEDVFVVEGAARGLAKAHSQGCYNVIITNQSGIGRGYFTEKEFQAVQEEVQRQVGGLIDATYMAPDLPNTHSLRRKPAPGMILEAAADLGIDLSISFMIGDRQGDIDAGKAAGCRTILVLTGYGEAHRDCGADFIVSDVTAAIDLALALILAGEVTDTIKKSHE